MAYFAQVIRALSVGEFIDIDYYQIELPKYLTALPMEMRDSVDQVISELKQAGFRAFDVDVNLLSYHHLINGNLQQLYQPN